MKPFQAISTPDNLNKKPNMPQWHPQETPAIDAKNVYLEARREWNERYGDYISGSGLGELLLFCPWVLR